MRIHKRLLTATLLLLIFTALNAEEKTPKEEHQPETPELTVDGLNVKDFGAKGDGKTDDTKAIQNAINAACTKYGEGTLQTCAALVKLPPGHYRITQTIKISRKHKYLVFEGTGGVDSFGTNPTPAKSGHYRKGLGKGTTQIFWDGEEGGLMFDLSNSGLQMKNICFNGDGKADTIMTLNSYGGGSGRSTFTNITLSNAKNGFVCGNDSYRNSADLTFIDLCMVRLKTGFKTMSDQNVDYLFIRPRSNACELVLHFKKGGNAEASSLFAIGTKEIVRIDSGGINAGTFFFSNMRIDHNGLFKDPKTGMKTKPIICRARGETNVKFDSLDIISVNARHGDTTPAFILGPHANVSVESSIISGTVASLQGKADTVPTWIQFDNCRFRMNSDPRKIKHDEFSGFELRNCAITEDEIIKSEKHPKIGKYVMKKSIFIPHYVRHPKQAEGQPGYVKPEK